MFCYRDRSFCSSYAHGACVNHGCDRAMTDAEYAKAKRWHGLFDAFGEIPIAYVDFAPTCDAIIAPEGTSQ